MTDGVADKIVYYDPKDIVADDNIRYGLKPLRLEELGQSILEQGRVLQPVGIHFPNGDKKPHLVFGFYRHGAALQLNKEGAGLQLPCIILTPEDVVARMKTQVAENAQREDMSPMDRAVAMKRLLDANVDRGTIRRMFAVPTGKKNLEMQPISNALLNIYVRFLDLPKAVQEKIHDGRIGVNAAYELGRVSPDKRAAVLEAAEKERVRQMEQEEKDEEKYLAAERKAAEAETKVSETEQAEQTARQGITEAEALLAAKKEALKNISNVPEYLTKSDTEKAKITEQLKAGQADVKAAEKLVKDAKNALAKSLKLKGNAAEAAAKHKAALEAARKAKPKQKAKAVVDRKDIKTAAVAAGASTGAVPLNLSEIRQALKDLIADGVPPRVQRVAKIVKDLCDGKNTPKETIALLDACFAAPKAATSPTPAAPAPTVAAAPAKK